MDQTHPDIATLKHSGKELVEACAELHMLAVVDDCIYPRELLAVFRSLAWRADSGLKHNRERAPWREKRPGHLLRLGQGDRVVDKRNGLVCNFRDNGGDRGVGRAFVVNDMGRTSRRAVDCIACGGGRNDGAEARELQQLDRCRQMRLEYRKRREAEEVPNCPTELDPPMTRAGWPAYFPRPPSSHGARSPAPPRLVKGV
jgi:hypothetical protein